MAKLELKSPGRLRLRNRGFIPGRNVRVTNPKAMAPSTNRRTPSLGMGGIEQYRKL